MKLDKKTKIYFSEIGNNNFIYPNKKKYIILDSDIEIEFLELFNSERYRAFKMLHNDNTKIFWVLL
tara:strand:- start:584 stop:781 length:198 start_codon:yes stop_codon:yes gene_type:complete